VVEPRSVGLAFGITDDAARFGNGILARGDRHQLVATLRDAARGDVLTGHPREANSLEARLKEKTQRGTPPTPGTLDREVELLKRLLGYAVKSGELKDDPLRGVQLLRKPNVRRMVLDEAGFQRLFAAAEEALQPILLLAFDTGMPTRWSPGSGRFDPGSWTRFGHS
jgi:hypothetical protein